MDDQAGLFDRPEQELPATPSRSTWGRARERFARAVVVDLVVRDAAALRAEALRALGRAVPVSAAEGDADADLLDPEEEILTSSAAALQWCLEPTNGHVAAARVRRGAHRRDRPRHRGAERDPGPEAPARAEIERSFAAAWHWVAEPCAPLAGIPGVIWRCVDVTVEQVLAGSR